MKMIIKDEDLILYVTDQMPLSQRKQFEQNAIACGQTDLLVHSIISNYRCHTDYADDLLGADTFDEAKKPQVSDLKQSSKLQPNLQYNQRN